YGRAFQVRGCCWSEPLNYHYGRRVRAEIGQKVARPANEAHPTQTIISAGYVEALDEPRRAEVAIRSLLLVDGLDGPPSPGAGKPRPARSDQPAPGARPGEPCRRQRLQPRRRLTCCPGSGSPYQHGSYVRVLSNLLRLYLRGDGLRVPKDVLRPGGADHLADPGVAPTAMLREAVPLRKIPRERFRRTYIACTANLPEGRTGCSRARPQEISQ